jgi:hypothetical protein
MLRKLCWCLLVLLYWAIVVHFLRTASPVYFDGGGPMPSFYWGTLPQPDLGGYNRNQVHYDLLYSVPYYLAGLVITLVGCVAAPLLLKQLRTSPAHSFRSAASATLGLLILAAMISDAGTLLRIWRGPVFLLHSDYRFFPIWWFPRCSCPLAF